MKAYLMYRDRDFEAAEDLPPNVARLVDDLELQILFGAMAADDNFLAEVVPSAVLSGLSADISTIAYRQAVLRDCIENPEIVRDIYAIALDALESKRKSFFGSALSRYPSSILSNGVGILKMLVVKLAALRDLAATNKPRFSSEGFGRFFQMILDELDDDYFGEIGDHLKILDFRYGVPVSAGLGAGQKGANYVLRREPDEYHGLLNRLFRKRRKSFTIHLAPRDNAGARAVGELRDRGLNLVANAIAQSNDHILDFFNMLRRELAFYLGCLNLKAEMERKNLAICFPEPTPPNPPFHNFAKLYDICLALTKSGTVVGNDLDMAEKDLIIITGANQGGKSTFLRSIGIAQLMMQSGMFVPAEAFTANMSAGIFSHFKREEDATMESGKFDEELSRMSEIAEDIGPNAMILFNESFSATNEKEGSEIARQIVAALLEKKIKILFVTHFYDLAEGFFKKGLENALFLRAERKEDGRRTYRLIEGKPLRTSFGQDLYEEIFGSEEKEKSETITRLFG